jgi:hydrogenase maturation protease
MEDAAEVARYRRVLFVDADRTGPAPFRLQRLRPAIEGSSFSTHSVAPGAVLALSRDLFHAEPEAWLLGIRGYEFDDFGEGLSDGARANLEQAVTFLRLAIEAESLDEVLDRKSHADCGTEHEEDPCLTHLP